MASTVPSFAAASPVAPAAAAGTETVTLSALAASVNLTPELAVALWEHMELDPEVDAEVAANIPSEVLNVSITEFVEARELSAGVSGRISLIFTKLERHRAAIDGHAPTAAVQPADTAAAAVHRGKMSAVLDQADDSTYEALDPSKRAALRANHESTTGGPPPVGRDPSADQLAAMMARLNKGEAPYADFAVFQPHGRRLAKYHKFDA